MQVLRVTPEAWLALPPPVRMCTGRCLPPRRRCERGNEHTHPSVPVGASLPSQLFIEVHRVRVHVREPLQRRLRRGSYPEV